MIYLRLSSQESVELFRILTQANEKKISSRLEEEIIHLLDSDSTSEQSNARSWMEKQQKIIQTLEEK